MKRLVAIAAICIGLGCSAHAQNAPSAETLQTAQELADVFSAETVRQMTESQMVSTWPAIERQFADKIDAEGISELRVLAKQSSAAVAVETMKSWPAVYAKVFTLQELRDMLAFYKSSTGAKTVQVMPKLVAEIGAQSAPRVQILQQEMLTRMQAVVERHVLKAP
ncbi:MAG TPA: DUF2059 domain-containing protein [Pseudolabrys sp.]